LDLRDNPSRMAVTGRFGYLWNFKSLITPHLNTPSNLNASNLKKIFRETITKPLHFAAQEVG
jgi:hypothetical protein